MRWGCDCDDCDEQRRDELGDRRGGQPATRAADCAGYGFWLESRRVVPNGIDFGGRAE